MIRFLVSFFIILLVPLLLEARYYAKITLKSPLKQRLNAVLKTSNELHTACFKQDEEMIQARLKSLSFEIDKAKASTSSDPKQKMHVLRILEVTKTEVEKSRNYVGKKRKQSLKSVFRQVVQIARMYKLEPYRVFFCPKDKSTWLQKSWKPKHPLEPKKFKNCGKRVT